MKLWCIVPVKPFNLGKSRLSPILSAHDRSRLSQSLFTRTLSKLKQVESIEKILVVTRDPFACKLARSFGIQAVLEPKQLDLNEALKRATTVAKLNSATSILIIPADLPQLESRDVESFISLGILAPKVIIASDKLRMGTNALMINPLGLIDYRFGKNSFSKHCRFNFNNSLKIVDMPSFEIDLDNPEDFFQIQKMGSSFFQEDLNLRIL